MRVRILLIGILGLFFNQAAWAFCEGHFISQSDLQEQITGIQQSISTNTLENLNRQTGLLEAQLPCIDSLITANEFAQAYRYIGMGHFLRGDKSTATRWMLIAGELEPNPNWSNEQTVLPELVQFYEEIQSVSAHQIMLVEDKVLSENAGMMLYLDGREWTQAGATVDRPHLLFAVTNDDKHIVQRALIDGNHFPQQYLQDPPVPWYRRLFGKK